MTAPNYKIDLYDDSKVSPAVKRLAFCFNLVVADPKNVAQTRGLSEKDGKLVETSKEELLLEESLKLFCRLTDGTAPATFNADEKSYMHIAFLKAAAKIAEPIGWQSVESLSVDKARKLMDAAIAMKLIQ